MKQPKVCDWTYDEDEDCWHTECGECFVLNDGTPEENNFKYCYHCGKELRVLQGKEQGE